MTDDLSACRFMADPTRIRVGIRRVGDGWLATIQSRRSKDYPYVGRYHLYPAEAVLAALEAADGLGIPGIDLDLMNAYNHPFAAQSRDV